MSEPFGPDVQWFDHSKTENWERFRATVAALSAAQARLKEWEVKAANWMASPEALARLEGYRELGAQVARAENAADVLRTALKAARKALTKAPGFDGRLEAVVEVETALAGKEGP